MADTPSDAPRAHFSSRLQILLVERVTKDNAGKPLVDGKGNPYERVSARCILLGDGGEVVTVGRLRVPRALQAQLKTGVFRANFALVVPDYGDDKGDIVAQVTSLVEEPQIRKAA